MSESRRSSCTTSTTSTPPSRSLIARYLAGEAAAHAHTWSVIAGTYAVGQPARISRDHTRLRENRPPPRGIVCTWRSVRIYPRRMGPRRNIQALHRGRASAAATWGRCAAMWRMVFRTQGFDAEWQGVNVVTVDGDMVDRSEFFDEADLDAAIARFESSAGQHGGWKTQRRASRRTLPAHFAARDWDAMAETVADNYCGDDRRRVVNAGHPTGSRCGNRRPAGGRRRRVADIMSAVIAIRGERLVLARVRAAGSDPEASSTTMPLTSLRSMPRSGSWRPSRSTSKTSMRPSRSSTPDISPAKPPPTRTHGRSSQVVTPRINRREVPPTTPDWVSVDHRRGAAFAPGDMLAYLRAGFDLDHSVSIYIEAVHRLNDLGAVVTHAAHGTSQEGFDAEWRAVDLLTVEGDMISRCEVFDETDFDAAIARFDELSRPAPRLENAASRVDERFAGALRGPRLGRDGGAHGRRAFALMIGVTS